MSLEYLLTALIVVLLPGTGVVYTIAVGLGQGARASVWAALGCTIGIVPALLASITGLAALLHASALAFQVVKYLGVAYLFYMAWGALREGGALDVAAERRAARPLTLVRDEIALNVLNPKLSMFFLAFLPQFVETGAPGASLRMLELGGAFMALTFVVFIGYGYAASAARAHVVSRPGVMRWLRWGFAGAFGLLGLKLAFSDR